MRTVALSADGLADPALQDFTRLTDVALRRLLEPEGGLYLAESTKVIERAIRAGHRPRAVLTRAEWLPQLEPLLAPFPDVPVHVGDDAVLERLTGFHLHRGALASMHRPELPDPADLLRDARRVVVIEDVVDHTNVGAIFRSGAALGVDAVLLAPRCADPLYRRSVKVGMGAVFTMPWTRLPDWYGALPGLTELGFTTVALTLADDATAIEEAVAGVDRVALVLGSEGHGLTPRWEQSADRRAIIPMRAGIDSLNVAAATAVACYVTSRR